MPTRREEIWHAGVRPGFVSAGEAASFYRGAPSVIEVAAPAAGADWTQTVPGRAFWRVLFARAQLVTDATVASRLAGVRITDGSRSIFDAVLSAAISASTTTIVNWSDSAITNAGVVRTTITPNQVSVTMPELFLLPGFQIQSLTAALQAGDQWSAVRLWVEEYDTGLYGAPFGIVPDRE